VRSFRPMEPIPSAAAPDPVLLFDGECGLCHRVVRLLLRLDRRGALRFTPLQGASAQAYLLRHGLPTKDFSTLVFVPDWSRPARADFRLRTDGVIAALRATGGPGRLLAAVLAICPVALRDAGYRLVARARYLVFGPWQACPLPRPEWNGRFF
jgi:predicted DCC family thiol-disulfide oxidoreductase YuxK